MVRLASEIDSVSPLLSTDIGLVEYPEFAVYAGLVLHMLDEGFGQRSQWHRVTNCAPRAPRNPLGTAPPSRVRRASAPACAPTRPAPPTSTAGLPASTSGSAPNWCTRSTPRCRSATPPRRIAPAPPPDCRC